MRWVHQNVQFYWLFMSTVIYISYAAEGIDNVNERNLPPSSSHSSSQKQHQQQQHQQQQHQQHYQQQQHNQHSGSSWQSSQPTTQSPTPHHHSSRGSGNNGPNIESRSSYAMLSEAMSQAVHHEFNLPGSGSADGACMVDDTDCLASLHDRIGLEAIKSLHQQLDDDDNGNIDLEESDDFLREELKYDSGYEKRHRAFHYNDDMHISVKELWESWLRSEVHNWTVEQTTEWLAQSVQLPQYVELFKQHKVTGATLPRLAVNNMHYVSNVLGIKDPIHKQKIALKAMDVVLFGPPRETGTRWKDYILVTLLLSAIIGCWYAYQQNKNAKKHLRRMAQDMEGLQKAENALTEMQKELERARLEQENVATEKLDLERRLKETPTLTSSSSDLELQQLKQEIEMLRSELSKAEVELVDHCWTPPQGLQSWLQFTYELENKHHLKKRIAAEKQLQTAREACEKLKRKRSSLVGAFVSTHGKSIDDVDRSIVEARNSLSEVTNELQERMHRWKQMESLLGFSIVNNNGFSHLENILYNRNGSGKTSRARITSSQDDLDDESVQGMMVDNYGRRDGRDDSSASGDDVGGGDNQSTVTFIVGSGPINLPSTAITQSTTTLASGGSSSGSGSGSIASGQLQQHQQQQQQQQQQQVSFTSNNSLGGYPSIYSSIDSSQGPFEVCGCNNSLCNINNNNNNNLINNNINSNSNNNIYNNNNNNYNSNNNNINALTPQERVVPVPRTKKQQLSGLITSLGRAPLPPPRRTNSNQSQIIRSQSTDVVSVEPTTMSSIILQAAAQPAITSTIPKATNAITTVSAAQKGSTINATTGTPQSTATNDVISVEDTYSTDSSSLDDEFKKRRRKLHFPFGKNKNKNKNV